MAQIGVVLRQWRDEDRQPYAAINQDPEVMRYLGAPRSREESDGFVDWASGLIAEPAGVSGQWRSSAEHRASASSG